MAEQKAPFDRIRDLIAAVPETEPTDAQIKSGLLAGVEVTERVVYDIHRIANALEAISKMTFEKVGEVARLGPSE